MSIISVDTAAASVATVAASAGSSIPPTHAGSQNQERPPSPTHDIPVLTMTNVFQRLGLNDGIMGPPLSQVDPNCRRRVGQYSILQLLAHSTYLCRRTTDVDLCAVKSISMSHPPEMVMSCIRLMRSHNLLRDAMRTSTHVWVVVHVSNLWHPLFVSLQAVFPE
jgi:hypothetical protein